MKRFLISLLIAYSLILTAVPVIAREINIIFSQPPNSPYFIGQPELNIDAEEFSTVLLRIKSGRETEAGLFWATNFDPQLNEPKSVRFTLKNSDHFKDYVFNLGAQNRGWAGFVGQLVVYPDNGPAGITVEAARALEGNWWTAWLSGWREFFSFEQPQLRSVNFIFGPKINGHSVNLYIYWLIAILAAVCLGWDFYRHRNIGRWKSLTPKIIILCLVCWVLLDLRIMLDQAKTAWLDLKTFSGKTLAEKQALTTFGDFYGFLQFASQKLPAGAHFNLLHPQYYYYREKATYYLYPRPYDEKADFLLVYGLSNKANNQLRAYVVKGFKPLAVFKERAYILKR